MSSADRLFTPRFFVMCGFSFTVFLSAFQLLPTAPFHIIDLGGSTFASGMFLGFLTYSSAFSAPLTGAYADRVGQRRILVFSSLSLAVFAACYAVITDYRLMLALALVQGVFWSGLLSASAAYTTAILPERRRAEGIGYWGLSTMAAIAVAPTVGFWIYRYGWVWLCVLAGVLNLVMASIAWTLEEHPRAPAAERAHGGGLLEWRVLAISVTLFLYSYGYGGITSFAAMYADASGTSPRGLYLTALAIVILCTRPMSGRLGDVWGYRRVFVPCLVLISCGLACLALGGTRFWMLTSAIIFGIGFGTAYPAYIGYVMRDVSASRRGAAFGAVLAAFDTGIGTGSMSMGWLIGHLGFAGAFGVAAALSALALPYFLFIDRIHGQAARTAHGAGAEKRVTLRAGKEIVKDVKLAPVGRVAGSRRARLGPMRGRFQPPLLVTAAALLGLIAILATLQYRWLGQISAAERDRMTATLNLRAAAFAEDFDRELTLAYSAFHLDLLAGDPGDSLAARLGSRFDRWRAAARYPHLVSACYVASHDADGSSRLQRFDPSAGALEPAEWPEAFDGIRRQIETRAEETVGRGTVVLRTMAGPLWESVPAILIPGPFAVITRDDRPGGARGAPSLSYTVLLLDRDHITREILPALAQHHFGGTAGDLEYQLAVVTADGDRVLYESIPGFRTTARTDATADLFGLRAQELARIAADVRRFVASAPAGPERRIIRDARSLALLVDGSGSLPARSPAASAAGSSASAMGFSAMTGAGPKWRLLVVHPSGSLDAAVASARRRNLLISMSVLGVLAASIGLLVASTRRSQELARQQMEFVAAVSHELRTPLAVIRSAGDNLADGAVRDEAQIRRYGALVRSEGRRLTGMVEQILEFAGIHSGQRTLETAPVALDEIMADVLKSSAPLVDAAGIRMDVDIPPDLPPAAGDGSALRRVFQNLIDNAIKYGEGGGWIGITARREAPVVSVTISDRGIGIAPADQTRIFEPFYRAPDVVAAQIQGAGLGLSLVHRIVEAHGGRITVKSTKGEGSAFTVHLPAATARTAGATLVPPGRAGSPHPRPT